MDGRVIIAITFGADGSDTRDIHKYITTGTSPGIISLSITNCLNMSPAPLTAPISMDLTKAPTSPDGLYFGM
jgi:hypothetical protein